MPNGIRTEKTLIYFRHLKVSWVKSYHGRVLLSSICKTDSFVCGMYRMKRLWKSLETCTFLIQQKITGKVDLYTSSNTESYSFKVWGNNHSYKRLFHFFFNTKVINRVFISCITD